MTISQQITGSCTGVPIKEDASMRALLEAQKAFDGVAAELGVKDEQNVVDMVREVRAQRSEQYQCE